MDNGVEFDQAMARWRAALSSDVFEDAFAALEESVACLETGRLTLERSLRCFEVGAQLAEQCDRMLTEAELRVSRLDEVIARIGSSADPFDGNDLDEYSERR